MKLEEPEEDRRGDVVGQIADDPEPSGGPEASRRGSGRLLRLEAAQERDDVDGQDVAREERHIRGNMPGEIRDQVAVDLHGEDWRTRIGQWQRQRPAARADLEEYIARRRIDGSDDLPRPARRQKVLTKPFTRPAGSGQSSSVSSIALPRQYRSSISSISSSDKPK